MRNDNTNHRRVILVFLGGLGNQLFQLCAGETIRRRTGLPVSYDCELGYRADPFGRHCELLHLIPAERRAGMHPGKGPLRSTVIELLQVALERQWMWRRGVSSLPFDLTLKWVKRWPSAEVVCRGYFQLLEFLDPETVEQIRAALVTADPTPADIAVHFRQARDRLASGSRASQLSDTVLPLDYYRECLSQVRADYPGLRFRVFSDTGAMPEDVFHPCDEVILDSVSDSSSWDTLARMASCRHFITANSSFSWWAAFLGREQDKQVYAPRDWLFTNGVPPQVGIFPPDWRRVPATKLDS